MKKEEQEFWQGASEAENFALLVKIGKLRRKGVDIESLFDAIDSDKIGSLRAPQSDDL